MEGHGYSFNIKIKVGSAIPMGILFVTDDSCAIHNGTRKAGVFNKDFRRSTVTYIFKITKVRIVGIVNYSQYDDMINTWLLFDH